MEGKPIDGRVLSHAFGRMVKKIGLNGLRFHDLRHTFASLMLLRGAKPKVISEALGHASVAFTMDTYSHIIEGMQEDAMALLAAKTGTKPRGKKKTGKKTAKKAARKTAKKSTAKKMATKKKAAKKKKTRKTS